MATVWLTQIVRRKVNDQWQEIHDTSGAEVYGERRYLLDDPIQPWRPREMAEAIKEKICDFDPVHDYLLFLGSPICCAVAFAMAADKARCDDATSIKMLYWHNRSRKYEPIIIPLEDLDGPWLENNDVADDAA